MATKSKRKLPVGSRECECPSCGQRFVGFTAFDAHRKCAVYPGTGAHRPCMSGREMQKAGWTRDDRFRWSTPKRKESSA